MKAVALLTGKAHWSQVVAFRSLVELDLKSYGLRSIELHHLWRLDFYPDRRQLRLRVSKSARGEHTLYLSEDTCRLIVAYLVLVDAHVNGLPRRLSATTGPC